VNRYHLLVDDFLNIDTILQDHYEHGTIALRENLLFSVEKLNRAVTERGWASELVGID
jgi:hypothetical protein